MRIVWHFYQKMKIKEVVKQHDHAASSVATIFAILSNLMVKCHLFSDLITVKFCCNFLAIVLLNIGDGRLPIIQAAAFLTTNIGW